MKTVTLTDTGHYVDVPGEKHIIGQVWTGTDENGEPVDFVVSAYVVSGASLAAMQPLPELAPEEPDLFLGGRLKTVN